MMFPLALLALLGVAPAAPARVAPEDPPKVETAAPDAYKALVAEFDQAEKAFREAIRNTESLAERRELRANPPAQKFQPRFQALVDGGDGRGLLWMLDHQKELGVDKDQRAAQALDYFQSLVNDYAGADWYPDMLGTLADNKYLSVEQRANLLKRVQQNDKAGEPARVRAQYHMGSLMLESKDQAQRDQGKALLQELIDKHPKSEWALRANAQINKANIAVGEMAPDFIGTSIDGESWRLSDFRGKVVLVDFFGFWWGPCKGGMPHLKALVERHKDDPFVLLGVNTGDEPTEFREGLATYGVTWRAAYQGPEGLIAKLYQVNAYPTYFLIGPDGKILGTGHNGEAYDEKIAKLVAEIKKAQESK